MKNLEILNLIAAYVDKQNLSADEKIKIESSIASDPELKMEFQIQSLTKKLVSSKIKRVKTPDAVRSKILKQSNISSKKNNESSLFSFFLHKPIYAVSYGIVLLAFFIVIFKINESKNFRFEFEGANNMFIQAGNNFNSILAGSLKPQFLSVNPDSIREFFIASGVNYPTEVQLVNGWSLVGAVVSENHGEKLAHHVYMTESGAIVYVFQVDENLLMNKKIIELPTNLIAFINDGNCFTQSDSTRTVMITKSGNNICTIVTNCDPIILSANFCTQKNPR